MCEGQGLGLRQLELHSISWLWGEQEMMPSPEQDAFGHKLPHCSELGNMWYEISSVLYPYLLCCPQYNHAKGMGARADSHLRSGEGRNQLVGLPEEALPFPAARSVCTMAHVTPGCG